MSEDILDQSTGGGSGERPQFLTVLCILTFIGSGLGVLGGLLGLIGVGALGSFGGGYGAGGLSIVWTLLGIAGAGLCLFGALKMWNLEAQGFMLYVAGCGIAIVVSILNVLTIHIPSFMAGSVYFGVAIGVAINVAFILMYNANKHALK